MEAVDTVLVLLIIVPQADTTLCHVMSCDQQYSCAPQTALRSRLSMTTIVNSQMSSLLKGEISSKCSEKWPTVCDSSSDGSVYVHFGGVF